MRQSWEFLGHCFDGDSFLIDGIDVWTLSWEDVPGEVAQIKDPLYGQDFTFRVYTITDGLKQIKFAAGEFSNNVWGFYVPE